MLRRRPKNNPWRDRKLRAQVTIVQKEKMDDNGPEVQTGVQAGLWLSSNESDVPGCADLGMGRAVGEKGPPDLTFLALP